MDPWWSIDCFWGSLGFFKSFAFECVINGSNYIYIYANQVYISISVFGAGYLRLAMFWQRGPADYVPFLSGRPLPATLKQDGFKSPREMEEPYGEAAKRACLQGYYESSISKSIKHTLIANIGYIIRYWRFVAAGLGKVSLFRFTSSPGFSTVLMNVLSWGFRTVKELFFSDIDLTKVFKDFNRYFAMSMVHAIGYGPPKNRYFAERTA
jgi:hypothetical protein